MQLNEQLYAQPEKDAVRQRVIAHAVASLSSERESSPVVTEAEFNRTMGYCCQFLAKHRGMDIADTVKPVVEDWLSLHQSRVGVRKAEDLSVLFLAGPDPVPDLMAFKRAGVPFANIWAIEGHQQTFQKAVGALRREGISLKIHREGLQKFFSIVPQQFDIVYFDACGPLFGGDPATHPVLRELFLNQRLSPLSVLITNFSEPVPNFDAGIVSRRFAARICQQFPHVALATGTGTAIPQGNSTTSEKSTEEERQLLEWGKLIGLWSYAHGDMDTWTKQIDEFVDTEVLPNLLTHYSRFTTEFITRFAGQLLGWWRSAALPGARREYFSDDKVLLEAAEEAAKQVESLSHPLYPALRHVLFSSWELDQNSPLHQFYFKDTLHQAKLGDAVKAVSLMRNYYESKSGNTYFSTDHIKRACNPNLVKALDSFKWFDHDERVFCDIPLPNLIADLLIGLYGYPYHTNTRKLQRIAYKAKETVMFTDVFVLDQARYLYDLLPTLPFFQDSFPVAKQLVFRVCMDAIHRHARYGCPDLFHGCALASEGESGFEFWSPPLRESIGCDSVEE